MKKTCFICNTIINNNIHFAYDKCFCSQVCRNIIIQKNNKDNTSLNFEKNRLPITSYSYSNISKKPLYVLPKQSYKKKLLIYNQDNYTNYSSNVINTNNIDSKCIKCIKFILYLYNIHTSIILNYKTIFNSL